jgi:hypothetical protein
MTIPTTLTPTQAAEASTVVGTESSAEPLDSSAEAEESAEHTIARVWARLEPLLPLSRRSGHPIVYDRRQILEAIVYVMQTDCGWSNLPSRFPPWKTVHDQYVAWRKAGIWRQIWADIKPPGPRPLEKLQL